MIANEVKNGAEVGASVCRLPSCAAQYIVT